MISAIPIVKARAPAVDRRLGLADPAAMNVVFEDNHLLVVDKPAGLLVQGGDAHDGDDHLVARAQAYLKATHGKPGNVYVGLVHRLDRNTSGLVVLAKTSKAASRLSAMFAAREVDKRYLAVVIGTTAEVGTCEHWLVPHADGVRVGRGADAKLARLSYRALHRGACSLVEVALETGRKHQIRAQLAAAGHPLLGDRRYAPPDVAARFTRPALHARSIAFVHPVRATPVAFEAPLPADMTALLAHLAITVTGAPKIVG